MPETDHHQPAPDGDGEGNEVQPQEDFQTQSADGPPRRAAQHPAPLGQTASGRPDAQSPFQTQPFGAIERQSAPPPAGAPPAGTGSHVPSSEPVGPDQATRDQTIIDGLLTIYASIREEVRSYRVLLFSNLILAFTIPLSAIAVQDRGIFKAANLWIMPFPARCLFSSWLLGVVSMVIGLYLALPSLSKRSEVLAVYRAEQATKALAGERINYAIRKLVEAIDVENDRLTATGNSRGLFIAAFILFLACVTIEFALVLFSPLSTK